MTAPSSSVTSVAVTGTSTGVVAFQLKAVASISDGSTRDVTASAQWQTSDAALATVSPVGTVAVTGSGDVEFRATYQTVAGTLRLLVARAPTLPTFILSGTVREAGTQRLLPGARVVVSGGTVSGLSTLSDGNGAFSFSNLPAGTVAVESTRSGYLTPMNTEVLIAADEDVDVWMFAAVPLNAGGTAATARCGDGTWSWDSTYPDACVSHNGVAYPVCPGPLCSADSVAASHVSR
jgi:hypothetical protein